MFGVTPLRVLYLGSKDASAKDVNRLKPGVYIVGNHKIYIR